MADSSQFLIADFLFLVFSGSDIQGVHSSAKVGGENHSTVYGSMLMGWSEGADHSGLRSGVKLKSLTHDDEISKPEKIFGIFIFLIP